VLLWRERVYVPDSITLQEEIITKHHDSELAGHPGYTKTYKLITRNYWWPRILEDIKRYVVGCERCQATKLNRQPKRNHLYPNEVLQNPWEIVSIDLIGPLLESAGYDGILVIVDRFSKMARYIPINTNITAVRATGAQDSRRILSNITVYNYNTTHLQENPQRLG